VMVDTTFLIDLARGDPGARAAAERAETGAEALLVPAPALARFWEAVERSRRAPRDVANLRAFVLAQPGVPFNAEHALAAARFLADAAAAGAAMDPFDAMVAAVAWVEDETLLTRSARDFERIRDLRVQTY